MKKLLMVGTFTYYVYEEALCESLAGHFHILKYKIDDFSLVSKIKKYRARNNAFIQYVLSHTPDVVFFYRTNSFLPATIHAIRRQLPDIKMMLYHNDNPYVGFKNKLKFFFYLSLIPHVDLVYSYRNENIDHIRKRGGKQIKMLLPHFCTKIHYPVEGDNKKKETDLIYIGHYAPDGRDTYINALIQAGFNIQIYGNWKRVARKWGWNQSVVHERIDGLQYRDAIANANIAICFLSKKNHDVYTRRCFEIPAVGTLLLSEYTEELTRFFQPDRDAVFFRSTNELVQKVESLLDKKPVIHQISKNGHSKVVRMHSEVNRAKLIIHDCKALLRDG